MKRRSPATREAPETVLRLVDVHKSYRRQGRPLPALRGIDLQLNKGEMLFVCGPSGSGKTTLLSILGCLMKPDRGSVWVGEHLVADLPPVELARIRRQYLGFVFQKFNLVRGLTAIDNVMLPLLLRGKPQEPPRKRALQALEMVGVGSLANSLSEELSVGQCQRIALARAFVGRPRVILADEPTASLDPENATASMQMLRRLASDHQISCVVVTHDPRIDNFADRRVVLRQGELTSEYPCESPVRNFGMFSIPSPDHVLQ